MKKTILFILVLFAVNAAFSQQYLTRHAYAQKDTLRTQFKMAVLDIAVDRFDTATNASYRLCADVLAKPNDNAWLDIFMYPAVILLSTATPTDTQVKTLVNTLWSRCAILNTRR